MPDTYYNVYDIWGKSADGIFKNSIKAIIPPHGAKLYKLTGAE